MRMTQPRVWKQEIKTKMRTGMFEKPSETDNIYFRSGFKTGYRLALQHIGNYRSMDFSRKKNVKITKVSPIIDAIIFRTANHNFENISKSKKEFLSGLDFILPIIPLVVTTTSPILRLFIVS